MVVDEGMYQKFEQFAVRMVNYLGLKKIPYFKKPTKYNCTMEAQNSLPPNFLLMKVPYFLEPNPHPNLIHTQFWRFLKRKKRLVCGCNPHLSFNMNKR
jgi:hypothetical protein